MAEDYYAANAAIEQRVQLAPPAESREEPIAESPRDELLWTADTLAGRELSIEARSVLIARGREVLKGDPHRQISVQERKNGGTEAFPQRLDTASVLARDRGLPVRWSIIIETSGQARYFLSAVRCRWSRWSG